jgi:hypothetical protein
LTRISTAAPKAERCDVQRCASLSRLSETLPWTLPRLRGLNFSNGHRSSISEFAVGLSKIDRVFHFARFDARANQNFWGASLCDGVRQRVDVVNQVLLREPDGHGPEKAMAPSPVAIGA